MILSEILFNIKCIQSGTVIQKLQEEEKRLEDLTNSPSFCRNTQMTIIDKKVSLHRDVSNLMAEQKFLTEKIMTTMPDSDRTVLFETLKQVFEYEMIPAHSR